jgi:C-terminal processing protease CtpA/Prc
MKLITFTMLAVITILLPGSCEKIAMHPRPGTDNLSIFEEYMDLVTTKFALPDVKVISPGDSYFEIQYGFLPQDQEIGCIVITTFSLSPSDQQLETMMEFLKDARWIIIEIRGNFGGFIEFGARLVSYFSEKAYVFATRYIKNGPGPDDFAASKMKITPSGSPCTFTKPVMVLHDRISFSTGSIFPVMMGPLEHVTTIGQTSGGGTGEIIEGYLANGWKYTLSTSNLMDARGNPTDNGMEPDIPVVYNPEDTATDAIIERAILEIQTLTQ